jgi:hypothetical protein
VDRSCLNYLADTALLNIYVERTFTCLNEYLYYKVRQFLSSGKICNTLSIFHNLGYLEKYIKTVTALVPTRFTFQAEVGDGVHTEKLVEKK